MSKRTASEIGKSNVRTSKTHERRIAKLFTEWSGVEFRRRRVEGRGRMVILRDMTGDVIAADEKKKQRFNIEAKKEVGFSVNAMLENPTTNKFTVWWHQSTYDANLASGALGLKILPLVIFKPAPAHDFIALPYSAIGCLYPKDSVDPENAEDAVRGLHLWFRHFWYDEFSRTGPITHNVSRTKNKKLVPLELEPCFICRWHDFAANVAPESFFFE